MNVEIFISEMEIFEWGNIYIRDGDLWMREYFSQRWRFINAGIFISEMEIYECVDDYYSDGELSMPEYLSQRGKSIDVSNLSER